MLIFHRRRFDEFGNYHKVQRSKKKFDSKTFFFNKRRSVDLEHNSLSNVGQTTLTLIFIVTFVALAIVNLNDGKPIPIVNQPDIDQFVVDRLETLTSLLDLTNNIFVKPFDGKDHLYIDDQAAFVCPYQSHNFEKIVLCVFLHADFTIHNVLQGIPSYGKYIGNAIGSLLHQVAPEHFIVKDALNWVLSFIQRVVPLQIHTYTEQQNLENIDRLKDDETSKYLTKASFSFEPFSDDVIEVKEECELQCTTQTNGAAEFMFHDVIDISTVLNPITRIDYIFNILHAPKLYICQYVAEEKFGGTWIYFVDECLCGDSCSTTSYFGFSGCADLLFRIGLSCTSANSCTLERLCPYEDTKIELTPKDNKEVLQNGLNKACLDICAELSGYSTFETLVAIGAVGSSVSVNALGLSTNAFGGPFGVPAALIPGTIEHTAI